MKTEARVRDVTTTLEGERIGMTIDTNSLAHIMSIMTDLYSDPEMAVIREYSTNAYDAHIEAGVDRPIEVTTPTSLAPFFRVRDYGVGVDIYDIREIYSRYGASTKRNSNDVVGMLGLGCKSALTYTDQFTLTGIKNGVCTQVSVSRDEDGSGSMTVVSEYETDDPSGVEIIVPAKSLNSFKSKASYFFRFWDQGTVLLDGDEPRRIDGMWLSEDLLLTKEVEKSVVVMGNVPYPMPVEYAQERWPIVAFVEIGAIQFTPSRESLQMTAKTKTSLEHLRKRIAIERDISLAKRIDEAPTLRDSLRVALDAKALGFTQTPTYRGREIPMAVSAENEPFVVVNSKKYYGDSGWSNEKSFSATQWWNTVWLTGYEREGFTPYKRKKLLLWGQNKKINPHYFVLVKESPAPEWIDPAMVFPWQEVEEIKIPRKTDREDGRPSGSYDGFVDNVYMRIIEAANIDASKPLYYCARNAHLHGPSKLIYDFYSDATIIFLNSNRINKFKRDFPMAKELNASCREAINQWAANLSHDDKMTISLHINARRQSVDLSLLDSKKVEDPDLQSAIKLSRSKKPKLMEMWRRYGSWIDGLKFTNPLDKYPLANNFYATITPGLKEHLYIYMNAIYATEQELSK